MGIMTARNKNVPATPPSVSKEIFEETIIDDIADDSVTINHSPMDVDWTAGEENKARLKSVAPWG
jgi:hypothetical protein